MVIDIITTNCPGVKHSSGSFRLGFQVFLLTGLAYSLQSQALAEDQYRFDASEFNPTSFRDTAFEKQEFQEMRSRAFKIVTKFQTGQEEAPLKKRRSEFTAVGQQEKAEEGAGERRELKDAFAPVHDLAGDWVPGKIDLVRNGGFDIEPFNGTPVPYELNGHVDAQRGKPWEENE